MLLFINLEIRFFLNLRFDWWDSVPKLFKVVNVKYIINLKWSEKLKEEKENKPDKNQCQDQARLVFNSQWEESQDS